MKGIIDNIITFYSIQGKALSILIANTQKALDQSEKERKANEQMQRVENFVKDLTMSLNNMLTKFHFLKDRKSRKQERLSEEQTKAAAEFAIFVKNLTENARSSLLNRSQQSQSFAEKIDKEIRELEAGVGWRLRAFDKALDETNETPTLLVKFARNITSGVSSVLQACGSIFSVKNRRKSGTLPEKPAYDIKENFSAGPPNTNDNELENSCTNVVVI